MSELIKKNIKIIKKDVDDVNNMIYYNTRNEKKDTLKMENIQNLNTYEKIKELAESLTKTLGALYIEDEEEEQEVAFTSLDIERSVINLGKYIKGEK